MHCPFWPSRGVLSTGGVLSIFRGKIILSSIWLGGGIHGPPPNPCLRARPHLGRFCPFVRISVRGRAPFPYSGRKSGKEGSVFCLSIYRKEMPTISLWENSNSESRRFSTISMVPLFLHHHWEGTLFLSLQRRGNHQHHCSALSHLCLGGRK